MCKIFNISRSSYYKWFNKSTSTREVENQAILECMLEIHAQFKGLYGAYRMMITVNHRLNKTYNHKRIERIMSINGLYSVFRKKKKSNYRKSKPEQTSENILNRDFTTLKPNEKWVTDVTEVKVPGNSKKQYLSSIVDLYDNQIISYEVSAKNNAQLVNTTLEKAIEQQKEVTPLLHSDRGFQYTRKSFKYWLKSLYITQSMSRVSKCIDNGPMESFQGILKDEMFILYDIETVDDFSKFLPNYVEFYNNERPQRRLKGQTPAQAREAALATDIPKYYPAPTNYRINKYWQDIQAKSL